MATRRLAAILAADVAGYSRLMAADEDGTLARLKDLRADPIDVKIGQFHGHVVGSAGDSLLVEFASAVDAVQCAVELQARLAERNDDEPDDRRMAFRMGVNLGDVIADEGTIFGDGVNVAARLEKLSEPGAVVVARCIYEQVKGKLPYAFADMGDHTVHNIPEPVRAYRVAQGDVVTRTAATSPHTQHETGHDKPSIAVLPFTNMSGDPEQEYFSDGITEDIITELSRFRNLFVIARNSAFAFKGQSVDMKDIGRKLAVAYLVEGSVRKAANRVRITAQLIEAETGSHIWAERYDRDLSDIFAIQDEVARAIVSTVAYSVENERITHARLRPTQDIRAYDLVLRAWAKMLQFKRTETEQAVDLLERAVALDPSYARAYACLAQALLWQYEFAFTYDPVKCLHRGIELAERAVALDPTDSLGHYVLGYGRTHNREFDHAKLHFSRVLELNVNDSLLATWVGYHQVMFGDHEAGIETMQRARRLNPYLSPQDWWELGIAYFTARRYEEALSAFAQIPAPNCEVVAIEAACFAYLGRESEARNAMATYLCSAPSEMANYPGDDAESWRVYWRNSHPYRLDEDLEHLLEGLRRAGLPV